MSNAGCRSSVDCWEYTMSLDLESRLGRYGVVLDRAEPDQPDVSQPRSSSRRRGAWLAAAAMVTLVVGYLWSAAPESDRVEVGAGDTRESTATEPPGRAAVSAGNLEPIWPSTTMERLSAFQAAAETGDRDDLLDPRRVALGYLNDRLGGSDQSLDPTLTLEVGDFHRPSGDDVATGLPDDENRGYVTYLLKGPAGTYEGYVDVRRLGGETVIWYVTGSGTPSIRVEHAAYDGAELSTTASTFPGLLEVQISAVDEDAARAVLPLDVASQSQSVEIRETFAGEEAVTVLLRLFPRRGDGTVADIPTAMTELRLEVDANLEPGTPQ